MSCRAPTSPTSTSTAPASSGPRRSAARSSGTTRRGSTTPPSPASPVRSPRCRTRGSAASIPCSRPPCPAGRRLQMTRPPAPRGAMALAIRKHVSSDLTLDDYVASGAFDATRRSKATERSEVDEALAALLDDGDIAGMLSAAVRARKNILVSGGTSTGKTTFLNALLREVPPEERLILIEDTPELKVHHENAVGLLAARSELGEAQVSANDLVAASLRMRPDRIILGELRGEEAYAFLRAINTGHPGSMTTVHADGAERAIEQVVLLVLQAGTPASRDDVRNYIKSIVDVFVQFEPIAGKRRIAGVVLSH